MKIQEKKEIQKLNREALGLWRQIVRRRARKRCEVPECKKTKFLNAHHVEGYTTNKTLRYDPRNGLCLCPSHHKFGRQSAHKSFCFMYKMMTCVRSLDLDYLLKVNQNKVVITPEYLRLVISELKQELIGVKNSDFPNYCPELPKS